MSKEVIVLCPCCGAYCNDSKPQVVCAQCGALFRLSDAVKKYK